MNALPQASRTLAMALIASSEAPLLLLDGSLRIVAVSSSFCSAFDIDPVRAVGAGLAGLGAGEWDSRQLASLLRSTASGLAAVDGYEMDLHRPGQPDRKLILTAKRLDHDEGDARVLLTATDITAARAAARCKDDLLRDQAILLEELQHRVANSLQIIASVLMQSASRVQSEETRLHLHDAHSRVMSIAKVQQHLSLNRLGDVDLRAYLTSLCESIAASMIADPSRLTLVVTSDASRVKADVSVSLGLIVTELVINALKHGFPARGAGSINVGYRSSGRGWTLSVDDNGIGRPQDVTDIIPGLGTGIVEALARRLDAGILMRDMRPGLLISITHADQLASSA